MAAALQPCSSCGSTLRSALVCEACGEIAVLAGTPGPFQVFGLEPVFALDRAAMRQRLIALSRALHPDFHANAGASQRQRAQEGMALLNAAHAVLADESRRADWLVRWLGGPDESTERSMPPEFLQEVLEWNEIIEAARSASAGTPERRALEPLGRDLRTEQDRRRQSIASLLMPLPERGDARLRRVRQELNALRYLERALGELGELALQSPS